MNKLTQIKECDWVQAVFSQGLNFIVAYSIKRSQVFKILHLEHVEFQIFI